MRFLMSTHSRPSTCNESSLMPSCMSMRTNDCLRCLRHAVESAIILCKLSTLSSSSDASLYSCTSSSSRHSSTPSRRVRFDSRVYTSAMYTSFSSIDFLSLSTVAFTSSIFFTVWKIKTPERFTTKSRSVWLVSARHSAHRADREHSFNTNLT